MTAALNYLIPDGSMPQSAMQEEISKAYVHMVASAAGLTLQRWDTDYGAVDLTLKSYVDYGAPGGYQPAFDVQLKATYQDLGTGDSFGWPINRRTHEKLTNPNRANLSCLAVLALPEEPTLWLNHDTAGLLARSHMYWLRADGFPDLRPGAESVTVTIPKGNRFGPKEALEFMEEAGHRWA